MRHRLLHALAGLCASVLPAASLVVVAVALAPAAEAAAPPGTPWTFGENSFGQLGNGTTTTRRTGAPVNGLERRHRPPRRTRARGRAEVRRHRLDLGEQRRGSAGSAAPRPTR